MGPDGNWYGAVFDLIDMRSFSNLWYWLALAVVWSWASHFVLGVPYDMVLRARRRGGQAERDLEDMIRIHRNRLRQVEGAAGILLIGSVFFLLTFLGLLGFLYAVEFAQAVFLLAAPFLLIGAISVRAAHRIEREAATGAELIRRIAVTRFWIQLIGLISIFVAAFWGMLYNFASLVPHG